MSLRLTLCTEGFNWWVHSSLGREDASRVVSLNDQSLFDSLIRLMIASRARHWHVSRRAVGLGRGAAELSGRLLLVPNRPCSFPVGREDYSTKSLLYILDVGLKPRLCHIDRSPRWSGCPQRRMNFKLIWSLIWNITKSLTVAHSHREDEPGPTAATASMQAHNCDQQSRVWYALPRHCHISGHQRLGTGSGRQGVADPHSLTFTTFSVNCLSQASPTRRQSNISGTAINTSTLHNTSYRLA